MNDLYDPSGLSPAGSQRRQEILRLALRRAAHRRQRRRALGIGAGAAAVLLAFLLIAPLRRSNRPIVHGGPPTDTGSPVAKPIHPATPEKPKVILVQIQTDPTLLQRVTVPACKPTWKTLTDDELLRELAAAGRPAGLEYGAHGEVVVLYR
jgi:hypothetical protein